MSFRRCRERRITSRTVGAAIRVSASPSISGPPPEPPPGRRPGWARPAAPGSRGRDRSTTASWSSGAAASKAPTRRPPDVHPGAGGELEVLGHPAVEHEAFGGIVRVGEPAGVADPVEAVLVEEPAGQIVLAAGSRGSRWGRAPASRACRVGDHLELHPGHGQPDRAGRSRRGSAPEVMAGRGLGGTPARGHEHPVAARGDRERSKPLPQGLGQRRRRVEDHVQIAEEGVSEAPRRPPGTAAGRRTRGAR